MEVISYARLQFNYGVNKLALHKESNVQCYTLNMKLNKKHFAKCFNMWGKFDTVAWGLGEMILSFGIFHIKQNYSSSKEDWYQNYSSYNPFR